jgi:hypothetical protein
MVFSLSDQERLQLFLVLIRKRRSKMKFEIEL